MRQSSEPKRGHASSTLLSSAYDALPSGGPVHKEVEMARLHVCEPQICKTHTHVSSTIVPQRV